MDKKQDSKIKYRCQWCNYVMDEHHKIIKDKEERDKYENIVLPFSYCVECHEIRLQEENL